MQKSLNLLLVDDNRVIQNIHRSLVERLGHKPVLAYSGQEALALCRLHKFDAILMDVQMPQMDGMQTTQSLRSSGCHTPIIAVTGNDLMEDREACIRAGMNAFCSKPLNMHQLQAQLETIVR